MARILVLLGHPDTRTPHLCNALADAYIAGAEERGHQIRRIDLSRLNFPLLRSQKDWFENSGNIDIESAQEHLRWAEHIFITYPLWLGGMPAMLKGFFEQVMRPGFALDGGNGQAYSPLLGGRSARVVVTMGMPAFVYRWYFRAHSLKALERNILRFVGIRPVRSTVIGRTESLTVPARGKWLDTMHRLGQAAV
ncbi:dehydrogenase [Terrihabitans soli]|uniref:Dehydrogenase n=1 Tax=Terrihabitans soli TaxID=708113 RepID=A0A6S6QZ30_9HYPH|nr:NAD(P)H-dependent oxidoreductase [Terrihabitans soli]BCJ92291.1 dehydrogenase [Terrihabitans soli]